MTLFASIAVIWLMAGIQVLLFMTWMLISHHSSLRLTLRGRFMIVLFWPDTLADLIGLVREGRRADKDDDERS